MPDRVCNRIQGRTPVFDSCLDGLQMCVRCCQSFVTEAASGVSDVDPNGHVVRLSSVRFWFLRCSSVVVYGWVFLSVLWYLRLTMFVEIHQISDVDLLFFVDIVWDPSEVCFCGGSCWCRRRNLLLLIRFQHEGVCEA